MIFNEKKKPHHYLKKIAASLLAFAMIMTTGLSDVYAVNDMEGDYNKDISLTTRWLATDNAQLDVQGKDATINKITQRVYYKSAQVSKDYAPNSLSIVVKGLKNLYRDGTLKAQVGADEMISTEKKKEWSYTYNQASDEYVLTNNNAIAKNSVLDGFVDFVYAVTPIDSVNGFSQNRLSCMLYYPDGTYNKSNELSITNHTTVSDYSVDIYKNSSTSASGLKGYIPNDKKNDYVLLKYTLTSKKITKARNLEKENYILTFPEGFVMCNNSVEAKKFNSGDYVNTNSYSVTLKDKRTNQNDGSYQYQPESNYVYVAAPKSVLGTKINIKFDLNGAFYEDERDRSDNLDTASDLVATKSIENQLSYDFKYGTGTGNAGKYSIGVVDYEKDYESSSLISSKIKSQQGQDSGYYVNTTYLMNEECNPEMETIIDRHFISKQNGEFRKLEESEYHVKSIKINSLKNDAQQSITDGQYTIYACSSSVFTRENPIQTGNIVDLKEGTTITLPENTKSVGIVFTGYKESVCASFYVVDNIHDVKDDTLFDGGKILRSVFGRTYEYDENGDKKDTTYYPDKTIDVIGIDISSLDNSDYGRNILYRAADYNNIRNSYNYMYNTCAFNDLKEITKNNVVGKGTLSAHFRFNDQVNTPTKFSLYTVLPEGTYLTDVSNINDLFDNVSVTSEGSNVSNDYLMQHCTPKMIKNYKGTGRTYLEFKFNLKNNDLKNVSRVDVNFNLSVELEYLKDSGYSGTLESYLYYDDANVDISDTNLYKDNGKLYGGSIYNDINQNGSSDDNVSCYQQAAIYIYASSGQTAITKSIRGSTDNLYKENTTTEIGKKYSYLLEVSNGSDDLTKIKLKEDLEALGDVKGKFDSIRFSEGFTGDYDQKTNTITVNEPIGEGKKLRIYITMSLPTNRDNIGKKLKNMFSIDAVHTDGINSNDIKLDSNTTSAEITDRKGTISVHKIDKEDNSVLSGTTFELYATDVFGNKTGSPIAKKTTNGQGYANFKNLDYGKKYILVETKAPKGYEKIDKDIEVTLDDEDAEDSVVVKTIKDERKKGSLKVVKSSDLDKDITLSGAEYTINTINEDGTKKEFGTYKTDENGEINIKDKLPWGDYEIVETKAPEGYKLAAEPTNFTIDRNNCEKTYELALSDVQDDVLVTLQKLVKDTKDNETEETLRGAKFKIYKVKDLDNYDLDTAKSYGEFYTNDEGKIFIDKLPYGKYVLHEEIVPAGYEACKDLTFTLSPKNREISLKAYDKRKEGTITIQKTDGKKHIVTGAKFTLYDQDMNPLKTATVDEQGTITFDKLEWGTYHIKETKAPEGYELDKTVYDAVIKANNLIERKEIANKETPGSITIKKVDSETKNPLQGAEFNVCKNDGTVISTLTTGEDGKATLDDIPWGSYYLEEIKAPENYRIDKTKKRFAINYANAERTQLITIENKMGKDNSFKLTKVVNPDDTYADHGQLVFNYNISYEYNDKTITRNASLSFKKDDKSKTTTIDKIPSSVKEVKVFEYDTNRYSLNKVKGNETELVGQKNEGKTYKTYTLSLTGSDDEIVFENKKTDWENYSDSGNIVNTISKQRQLTSIKAAYNHEGSVKARSEIDRNELVVRANYDDGSSEILDNDDYTLDPEKWPNQPGSYTATVKYKGFEDSIEGYIDPESIVKDPYLAQRLKDSILPQLNITTDDVKYITLTTEKAPVDATLANAEQKTNSYAADKLTNGIVAWFDSDRGTLYISTQDPVKRMKLRPDASFEFANFGSVITINDEVDLDTSEAISMQGMFVDCKSLTEIDVSCWNTEKVKNMRDLFYGCNFLNYVDVSKWNIKNVITMQDMFNSCRSLKKLDIADWNTESLTNLYRTFSGCSLLERIDISKWDTSKVTSMAGLFQYCESLKELDLSKWNTKNVKSMHRMFDRCTSLIDLDITGWNTRDVIDMSFVFYGCKSLENLDLSHWKTSNVEKMDYMFSACSKLYNLNVSTWDTSSVASMRSMFYGCTILPKIDVDSWNTSSLTTIYGMFSECESLENVNVSNWDTSNITTMSSAFFSCRKISYLNVTNWKTANVTDMYHLFYNCNAVTTLDVSNWNTSNVKDMNGMFANCFKINDLNVSNFDTSKVTDMRFMFASNYQSENIDVSNWNISNVEAITDMFYDCRSLKKLEVTNWNTSKITDMTGVFMYDYNLDDVNFSNWDISKVESIAFMFYKCESLEIIDVSKWDTSKVTNMSNLFNCCTSLKSVDTSKWNTSKVTDMRSMFGNCEILNKIDVSSFNTINVINMSNMFYRTINVIKLDLSSFDTSNVSDMTGMFDGDRLLEKIYVSDKWNVDNVTDSINMFYGCYSLKGQTEKGISDLGKTDATYATYPDGLLTYKEYKE